MYKYEYDKAAAIEKDYDLISWLIVLQKTLYRGLASHYMVKSL